MSEILLPEEYKWGLNGWETAIAELRAKQEKNATWNRSFYTNSGSDVKEDKF